MGRVVKRIVSGYAVILLALSIIIVLLLIRTNMFNNQYESVLQNVLNLNTINVETANAAGSINNGCIMGQSIEESGILLKAEEMLGYLDELDKSIGTSQEYQGNRSMVNSLRQLLLQYQSDLETIASLGDGTNFPPINEEVNNVIADIRGMMPNISSYCNNNITMELARSAVIQEEINVNFHKTIYFSLGGFIGVLVAAVVICALIVKSIMRPIKILKTEITLVAEGDLTKEEIHLSSKDEFSGLADAFNMMSNNLKEIIGKVIGVTSEITNAAMIAKNTSGSNMRSSLEITRSTEDISKRMHEQSKEIETIMNQMQEMKRISLQISDDIKKIDSRTEGSKSKAEEGNSSIAAFVEQLRQVNYTVSQIAGTAEKFGNSTEEMNQILSGISGISQQTKLLSLNASIEAARAGEAGRGFAVVAGEINNLAEKTVELVTAISNIIEELRLSMKEMTEKMELGLMQLDKGNVMVAETQNKFVDILTDAGQTSEEIQSVHRMAEKLSQNAVNVSGSMVEVNGTIEENTVVTDQIVTIVENQTASQKELSDKVQILEELAVNLGEATSKFKVDEVLSTASSEADTVLE